MRSNWDHSWGVVSDGHVVCRSGGDTQGVASFAVAATLTGHHDERLAELTRRVNQLLGENRQHGDGRELAFLSTPDGIFLAWTENQHDRGWEDLDGKAIRADTADDEEVRRALGLR